MELGNTESAPKDVKFRNIQYDDEESDINHNSERENGERRNRHERDRQNYPRQQNMARQPQQTTVVYVVERDPYQSAGQSGPRYTQSQPQYVDQYGRPVQSPNVVYVQEPPPPQPSGMRYQDPDAVNVIWVSNFEDPQARRDFIRRTYTILIGQLSFFFGFIAFVAFYEPAKDVVKENLWAFMFPGMLIVISTMYIFCCCMDMLLRSPANYVILCLITIGYTCVLMAAAVSYKPIIIAMAIGITMGLFLLLTLFACMCKVDFTKWVMAVTVVLLVLILAGILASILVPLKYVGFVDIAISSAIALVFCMYIVIDTQMLMDNKKYSMDTDMEVFAAIMLFIDVANLFMFILAILGYIDNN